ncbi:MAG: PASTA domain-containing protein [bacterium]|nr:PASTA domain-containing protein [bacterium]
MFQNIPNRKIKPSGKSPFVSIIFILLIFVVLGVASAFVALFFVTQQGEEVSVPNVIGKDFATAFDIFSKHQLQIKKVSQYHNTVAENHIISQSPPPGSMVRAGRQIKIIISLGPAQIEVPDLTGNSLFQAKNQLSRAGSEIYRGLKVGYISYIYSDKVSSDRIISQTPPPNFSAPKGTPVSLLVSMGAFPTYLYMIEFRGTTLKEVEKAMEKLDITLGRIDQEIRDDLPRGTIIDQSPLCGYKIKKDQPIHLVVSTKSYEEQEFRYKAFNYIVPQGFYEKDVRIVLVDEIGERDIYHKWREPGAKIELVLRVIGQAKVTIYLDGMLAEERELE